MKKEVTARDNRSKPDVRLALCAAGELFGGVERHLIELCTWLQRQGHRPLLILWHDRELANQARAIGVEPVILEGKHDYDPTAAWRLAKVLRTRDVNVVHCHGYKAMILSALAKISKKQKTLSPMTGGHEVAGSSPVAPTSFRQCLQGH